jgi:hypothetical protein
LEIIKGGSVTMKKFLVYCAVIIFCATGTTLAKSGNMGKGENKGKTKIEKKENGRVEKNNVAEAERRKDIVKAENGYKEKEEHVQGQRVDPPEGVQKAAEKGKGKKKGLFERWFGGSKDK